MDEESKQKINQTLVIDPNPELYPHKAGEPVEKYFKPIYITREELQLRTRKQEEEEERKAQEINEHNKKIKQRIQQFQLNGGKNNE